MTDLIAQIGALHREVEKLKNENAHTIVEGTVCDVNHETGKYRLQFTEGQSGEPVKSPWLDRAEEAGTMNTHMPLKVGQPVQMLSPGGQIGKQSRILPAGHSDENPRHSNKGETPSWQVGSARIAMEDGKIVLSVGSKRFEITESELVTYGKTRLNDGDKLVHYKGGKDSANDIAVDGASDVYVPA